MTSESSATAADRALDRGDHRRSPAYGARCAWRRAPRRRSRGQRLAHGPLVADSPRAIGATAARSSTGRDRLRRRRRARRWPPRSRPPARRRRRRAAAARPGRGPPGPSAATCSLSARAVAGDRDLDLVRRRLADRHAGCAAASSTTPRAWPTANAVWALLEKNSRSTATRSGRGARSARRRSGGSRAAAPAARRRASSRGSRSRPSRSAAAVALDDAVAQRGGPRVDARDGPRSPGDLGEDLLGDVEVGGHALDVVEVLERLDQAQVLARLVRRRPRRSAWRPSSISADSTGTPAPSSALRTRSSSPGVV